MNDTSTREPSTVEVLRQARDLLADDGWCQKHYTTQLSGKVRHCSVGSLVETTGAQWRLRTSAFAFVLQAVIDLHGATLVEKWNDAPNRTLPEVLEVFDRAIKFAEAAEPRRHNMLCMDDEGRDCCPDPTHVGF